MIPLAVLEEIIDASGTAPRIEAALPAGVRPRQLSVRTLLAGMCLTQADHRPAHLTRVHQALVSLPADDQARLGVIAGWRRGPHLLTYRQTEYTFGLVTKALGSHEPDGLPAPALQAACDDLLEASIPQEIKQASQSLAVDWTDLESFSRPPPRGTSDCADPEASRGHRTVTLPGPEGELFFGYYFSAAIMTPEENGPALPELARRAALSSCRHDPVRAFVPVLTAMPGQGIPPGDILADSGYSHRDAAARAIPLRLAGAQLVQDLHPHDRGPEGTHHGAIISNGNLYCPQTPRSLLELGPLSRTVTREQAADWERQTAELARHKLGRITSDDADGYHRVACPAAMGKIRCPLRPSSMTLDRGRPEILTPPGHPQACCTRQTLTIPPEINAKTAQKHDYPSAAHRRSHARRTGRRTRLRHHQGPRQQRHHPRLVPPHGTGTANAVHHHAAHRPQPADPDRLEHPPGTNRAPRRRRAPPENPQTPPRNPRQPHRAAVTPRRPRTPTPAPVTTTITATTPRRHARTPPAARSATTQARTSTSSSYPERSHPHARLRPTPKREQGPHQNVKTSGCAARDLNPEPAD
jgi:hypothetical protein